MSIDPRRRNERRVEFLREQDGPSEQEFKALLQRVLRRHPSVQRAYLAVVGYDPRVQPRVALCISPQASEARSLVDDVSAAFSEAFSVEEALDILFVSDEQEADLRRVCSLFFERR